MTAARVPKRTPLNRTAVRKIIDRLGSLSTTLSASPTRTAQVTDASAARISALIPSGLNFSANRRQAGRFASSLETT